jgi:hypothetical protein
MKRGDVILVRFPHPSGLREQPGSSPSTRTSTKRTLLLAIDINESAVMTKKKAGRHNPEESAASEPLSARSKCTK